MNRSLLVIACSTLLSSAAAAAEIPRYDAEGHCKRVSSIGGSSSAMIENSCMDMEQTAYNKLKSIWASIPERARTHCSSVAERVGGGSYSLLESCIDLESKEASRSRKFQY